MIPGQVESGLYGVADEIETVVQRLIHLEFITPVLLDQQILLLKLPNDDSALFLEILVRIPHNLNNDIITALTRHLVI